MLDKDPLLKICITPHGVERVQIFGPYETQALGADLFQCIGDLLPLLDRRIKERLTLPGTLNDI